MDEEIKEALCAELKGCDIPAVVDYIDKKYILFERQGRNMYRTSKTMVAALLKCLGFQLVNVEFHGKEVSFWFSDKQKIIAVLISYENDVLQVNPKLLIKEFESLKSTIKGM